MIEEIDFTYLISVGVPAEWCAFLMDESKSGYSLDWSYPRMRNFNDFADEVESHVDPMGQKCVFVGMYCSDLIVWLMDGSFYSANHDDPFNIMSIGNGANSFFDWFGAHSERITDVRIDLSSYGPN
jgi:hypothetical protein